MAPKADLNKLLYHAQELDTLAKQIRPAFGFDKYLLGPIPA